MISSVCMTPPPARPPIIKVVLGSRGRCNQHAASLTAAHDHSARADSPATLSFELQPPSSCKQESALLKTAPPSGAASPRAPPSRKAAGPACAEVLLATLQWPQGGRG